MNATERPLVSIIIPSLNQGLFIEETIQSILHQNYRPIEIIIVDACSLDNTVDILRKYDKKPKVKWTSEVDGGQGDGINKGFSKAKGEIVAWLNSDDVYFSRDVIDTVVNLFQRKPEIDVIYGDVAIISKENVLLRLFLLPPYNVKRIRRKNMISQPAVFFRKHVAEHEKLDINQIGLDYEYWLRLGRLGYRFYHVRKILAGDRHYPERASVTKRDLINMQIRKVKTKYGISKFYSQIMHPIDRVAQAMCRFEGLLMILTMPIMYSGYQKQFAFPLKIDSFVRLFWRQMVKQIGNPM